MSRPAAAGLIPLEDSRCGRLNGHGCLPQTIGPDLYEVIGPLAWAVLIMPLNEREAFQRIIQEVIRHIDPTEKARGVDQALAAQDVKRSPGIFKRHVVELQRVFTYFQ